MRKALLVVLLVAASFAGGAVVNGPGLTWAKGLIGGKMRESEAIPTLNLADDGNASSSRPNGDPAPPKSTPFPAAPRLPWAADFAPSVTTPTPAPRPEPKPVAVAELPSETKPPLGTPQVEAPSLEVPPELPPSRRPGATPREKTWRSRRP